MYTCFVYICILKSNSGLDIGDIFEASAVGTATRDTQNMIMNKKQGSFSGSVYGSGSCSM
ncbi:hypothetical protein PHYBLDRAFT_145448 [Phycomyces blakesleeanus NRRL 1555(-)]|uniref:Uncharacterized protein n=1 Tax=Phycomyces blakesleeanus (strain ATCC 8743b / DSM 1359 / FGSC 10004 / NBRC 33097 / NRRL 1555) TaxID=763407 RepID=A0A167MU23_PHYB8|nr:hypothetical protein PHYBLDRAFT_145448 [Phycomyces blakesleeanus NRRL 1555(-)]OAD73984.1 hypothetical protein PHYBLDRAFT_145448 [Phycomyces blakesleeanus NRRL 1555(-)]|eukprot:XP_018292024.1 hypothetical protein PHYBLDRAFT_145448 [Phycomyces blakesleeanus NRRL 1555(-)]